MHEKFLGHKRRNCVGFINMLLGPTLLKNAAINCFVQASAFFIQLLNFNIYELGRKFTT
jgi:hypothetical protein